MEVICCFPARQEEHASKTSGGFVGSYGCTRIPVVSFGKLSRRVTERRFKWPNRWCQRSISGIRVLEIWVVDCVVDCGGAGKDGGKVGGGGDVEFVV